MTADWVRSTGDVAMDDLRKEPKNSKQSSLWLADRRRRAEVTQKMATAASLDIRIAGSHGRIYGGGRFTAQCTLNSMERASDNVWKVVITMFVVVTYADDEEYCIGW